MKNFMEYRVNKQNEKGEKMSLRKFISLLLLVSFVVTTTCPALATVTVNTNVSSFPTLAEDDGTVASQGANIDVVPLTLEIRAAAGDITFGRDGGTLANNNGVAAHTRQYPVTDGNGKLFISNGSQLTNFDQVQLVAAFKAPANTKFVKLTSSSYDDAATQSGVATSVSNGANFYLGAADTTDILRNITIDDGTALPAAGANGHIIVATVLDQQASTDIFGNNATSLPAGSLVINFLSPLNTDNRKTDDSIVINLTGIGLASDGTGSLGDTGNLTVTYIKPLGTNGGEALAGLTDGATTDGGSNSMKIATLGPSGDKLEVIMVGTKTGNDGATVVNEPDAKANTLLASLITGTTVKVGPGEFTNGGTTSYIDTDALVIRAKERPDSTASTVTYYQTPFETSKLVLSTPLSNTGTNADTLQTTSPTSSSSFPNQNALITVAFSLEDAAGGASSATLAVNAASVTLHGPRAFNSIRGAGATAGGQTTVVTSPKGFLGAALNLENGTTSGYANYTALVLYNGDSTINNYDVADVSVLNHDALAAKHGATIVSLYNGRYATATTIDNGTTALGIFPGAMVANGTGVTTGTYNLVNTANGQAISGVHTGASYGSTTGLVAGSDTRLATPTDLTARLLNGTAGASIGNTAWFILSGNTAGNSMTTAGDIKVYSTDTGSYDYFTGFSAQTTDTTSDGLNNVIAAAELVGANLYIMPVTNKYDGIRDAIAVRPEVTITVDDAAKTAGVKLVATVSGNNIASSTKITLATIIAAGTLTPAIDLTAAALPIHGDMSSDFDLMKESATDAGASRGVVDISTVTGASSTTDDLSDQIGTGLALDETTPPLFCGGTAGTSTRGPNGLVVQPKARGILLTENGGLETGFQDIEDLGANAVIRFTLPAGMDLNDYSATSTGANGFLGLETSGGLSASIDKAVALSSTATQAFVDVTAITSTSVTQTAFDRLMLLVFKPHALLVPEGQSDFDVTVAIYDDKGTAATTDDVLVGTLGTVSLASECSTFLTIAFCPDKLSDFDDSTVTTPTANSVESTHVTRGARETTYASAVGPALRLVETTPENITLPDVCITEGVADAIPLGSSSSAGSTGIPTAYGDATNTAVRIHIATSFAGDSSTGLVGISNGSGIAATSILFSDGSIEADTGVHNINGADNANNEVAFEVDTRSLTDNELPFEEITRIRIPGLVLEKPDSAKSFTDQNLIAWVEVAETASTVASGLTVAAVKSDSVVVGSSFAAAIQEVTTTTNEYFLSPFNGGSAIGDKMRNLFASKVEDISTNGPADADLTELTTDGDNDITVVTTGGNPATLTDATMTIVDSSSFDELNGDTEISVLTSAIDGTTALNALVSVGPGTLEPGTLITVDGTVDDVIVPVLEDGSFQANIRCASGTSINLSQLPDSGAITTPALGSATCEDQNVDPILLSAVANDIGLGTLTERGTAPVVFTVTASGKVGNDDFVPTADDLTLGGNPVVAVSGSTNKFIGIVNFNKSSGKTVATTAGDGSSVTLSGLDSSTATLAGNAPTLTKVKTNKKDRVILKGLRLGNKGLAYFVLSNGTVEALDLAKRNKNDASKARRRAEDGESIPATATHAVFHVPGKGISTLEL
jgi:hypothetical protein